MLWDTCQAWFFFYSALGLELLIWLGVAVHVLISYLRGRTPLLDISVFHEKDHRMEMYIGGCLRCLSVLLCGKKGGFDLSNARELKDVAVAAVEFANNDTKMEIVLSDLILGFKILARVQVEKRLKAVRNVALQIKERRKSDETGDSEVDKDGSLNQCPRGTKRTDFSRNVERRSMMSLELEAKSIGEYEYKVVERDLLMHENEVDMTALFDCAHYVNHSVIMYDDMSQAVHHFFAEIDVQDPLCFSRPTETVLDDDFYLSNIGHDQSKLCYASLRNNLAATVCFS